MSDVVEEKTTTDDAGSVIKAKTNNEPIPTSIGMLTKAVTELEDAEDSPRIIGNELLVKPSKGSADDHMDELFSLEREIAKMHNVVDDTLESVQNTSAVSSSNSPCGENNDNNGDIVAIIGATSSNDDKETSDSTGNNFEVKVDAITLGDTALEHEDLIAVLKGLDDGHNTDDAGGDTEMLEGVTIEGEGEYQIMEVIDDDYISAETEVPTTATTVQSGSASKIYGATVLTTEEERALAMEQMEGLNKPKTKRRRKQDIKPMQQVDASLDLVSSLEADWTDNDDDSNREPAVASSIKKESPIPVQIVEAKTNIPQITSVVVIPPSNQQTRQSSGTIETKAAATDKKSHASSSIDDKETLSTTSPVEGMVIRKTDEEPQVISSHSGNYQIFNFKIPCVKVT